METQFSVTELPPVAKPNDDPIRVGLLIANAIWLAVYGIPLPRVPRSEVS